MQTIIRQHRHFVESDLYNRHLLNLLASNLAKFHAIKPPLPKDGCLWPILFLRTTSDRVYEKLKQKPGLNENNRQTHPNCDLREEVQWILTQIESSDSPIVFSHNDFRFANNMVTEEDQQIVSSDFEISAYFNRGYDFAALFNGFDKEAENIFEFRDELIIKEFIDCYVRECEKIFGKQYSENEINSVDHIFMETKVFSMLHSLVVAIFFLDNITWQIPFTEKTCLVITLILQVYRIIKIIYQIEFSQSTI